MRISISVPEKDIEEMFSRLQNGTPLNAAEKRRAYHGNMKHVVINLGKHNRISSSGFQLRVV